MDDEKRNVWHRRWPYAVIMTVVLVAGLFVAGMWFEGRSARSVSAVVDSYSRVYAGSDSTKDVVSLVPLYASDAVLEDIAADRTYTGIDAIKRALDSLFATPAFNLTVERTLIGRNSAVVEWTANGTEADTGRLTQVSGVTVLEMSKGKIMREMWYYDPAKAPF